MLTARQQRNALQLLARRTRDDVDPSLQHILSLRQFQIGATTTEHLGEHGLEVGADLFKGLDEQGLGLGVDPVDDLHQLGLGLDQVIVLGLQERVALLGFFILLDRYQVHRPDVVHFPLERMDLRGHSIPIGRQTLLLHDLQRYDLDLGQSVL